MIRENRRLKKFTFLFYCKKGKNLFAETRAGDNYEIDIDELGRSVKPFKQMHRFAALFSEQMSKLYDLLTVDIPLNFQVVEVMFAFLTVANSDAIEEYNISNQSKSIT